MNSLDALVGKVHCLDFFELARQVPDKSIDLYLGDLPYGVTSLAGKDKDDGVTRWDNVIPFEPMWAELKRIIKPKGAIVLTANQPFTSALVMSNRKMFRYAWVWVKNRVTGFANAKKQPLRQFEDILVFGVEPPNYYPVDVKAFNETRRNTVSAGGGSLRGDVALSAGKGKLRTGGSEYVQEFTNYPTNVLNIDCEAVTEHPTQKPTDLFSYLIRTYTRPDELVADFTVGSGTTAVSALRTGRRFIVGDFTPEYVEIARKRLALPFTPNMLDVLEKATDMPTQGGLFDDDN